MFCEDPKTTEATDSIDSFLLDALFEDVLTIMLEPPRVPSFATDTVRPGKLVAS